MNFYAIKSKIEQAIRLLMVNTITPLTGSVIIVEYPKSGGTWLGQLVSDYLGLPFPRNRMPVLRRSVFHSHYLPKWRIPRNRKILFLVRDGRDVMVSLYHHQLIWNEKNRLSPKDVRYHRRQTGFDNFEDVAENMMAFVSYSFTSKPSKWQQFTYMGNWDTYNGAWLAEMKKENGNIHMIRYEDLLSDTFGTMEAILNDYLGIERVDSDKLKATVEKFSFEIQAKRKKGQEQKNSFLRKGIAGDWKNYFGEKEKEAFKMHAGDMLVKLGYEKDQNW